MKRCALVLLLLVAGWVVAGCAEVSARDAEVATRCRELFDAPFTNASAARFREKYPWSREVVTPLIEPPTGNQRAMGMTVSAARGLAWSACMDEAGFACQSEVDEFYPAPADPSRPGTDILVYDDRPRLIRCHRGDGAAIQDPFHRRDKNSSK